MMNDVDLPSKTGACWPGKAVGGTLGAPHEGKAGPLDLSFHDPVPTDILPNDDLDPQLVWLHPLQATGAGEVTPAVLADAWREHGGFPFDEYSVGKRNDAYGLRDKPETQADRVPGAAAFQSKQRLPWALARRSPSP